MVAKEKTENKQKGSVPILHPLLGAKPSRGATTEQQGAEPAAALAYVLIIG